MSAPDLLEAARLGLSMARSLRQLAVATGMKNTEQAAADAEGTIERLIKAEEERRAKAARACRTCRGTGIYTIEERTFETGCPTCGGTGEGKP